MLTKMMVKRNKVTEVLRPPVEQWEDSRPAHETTKEESNRLHTLMVQEERTEAFEGRRHQENKTIKDHLGFN